MQVRATIQAAGFAAGLIAFCHQFLFVPQSALEDLRREVISAHSKIEKLELKLQHAREIDASKLENIKSNLEKFMRRKGVRPIKEDNE